MAVPPGRDSAIYRNPVYHQVVFATLMISLALRTMYLINSDISKSVPSAVKKRVSRIYQTGLLIFLAGFVIWNVDNIYCGTLTEWKRAVGWPAAFFLEGVNSFRFLCQYLPLKPTNRTFVVACSDRMRFLQLTVLCPPHLGHTGCWLVLDDNGNNL